MAAALQHLKSMFYYLVALSTHIFPINGGGKCEGLSWAFTIPGLHILCLRCNAPVKEECCSCVYGHFFF
jgi:hypothetical protein